MNLVGHFINDSAYGWTFDTSVGWTISRADNVGETDGPRRSASTSDGAFVVRAVRPAVRGPNEGATSA